MVVGSTLHQTGPMSGVHEVDGKSYYFDGDRLCSILVGWVGDDWRYFKDDGTRSIRVLSRVTQCTLSRMKALVTDDKVLTVEADKDGAISVM